MSQSTLTSPFNALVSLRMFRRAGTRVGLRESTSRTRPAEVVRTLPRTDALRALDTDQIRVQSRIFLALR